MLLLVAYALRGVSPREATYVGTQSGRVGSGAYAGVFCKLASAREQARGRRR